MNEHGLVDQIIRIPEREKVASHALELEIRESGKTSKQSQKDEKICRNKGFIISNVE